MAKSEDQGTNPLIGKWRVVGWRIFEDGAWVPQFRYTDQLYVWEFSENGAWLETEDGIITEQKVFRYEPETHLLSIENDVLSPGGQVDYTECDRYIVEMHDDGRGAFLFLQLDEPPQPGQSLWRCEIERMEQSQE